MTQNNKVSNNKNTGTFIIRQCLRVPISGLWYCVNEQKCSPCLTVHSLTHQANFSHAQETHAFCDTSSYLSLLPTCILL